MRVTEMTATQTAETILQIHQVCATIISLLKLQMILEYIAEGEQDEALVCDSPLLAQSAVDRLARLLGTDDSSLVRRLC